MDEKIISNVKKALQEIKKSFSSDDVKYYEFCTGSNVNCALIFIDPLTDKKAFAECIIKPLTKLKTEKDFASIKNAVLSPEVKEINDKKTLYSEILAGNGVLIIDQNEKALSVGFKRIEKRAVMEPPTSVTLKGPREGFVEDLITNVSLLRRRLKTTSLKIEYIPIGKYSSTQVAICSIEGISKPGLKEEIIKKIKKINIDFIPDSSYVSKFLSERKTSLFKQVGTTEKPDIFIAKIMEGRVGILVDGSPFALTLPYMIVEDFQSADDYYSNTYKATAVRILRLISVMLAVLLPSLFVSAELFHLQLLPLSFLLTIVNSTKGIPLSPSFEMFLTLMIFEILNEASIRMPKYVGMAVSVVGGLVLGETAVNAGIISAPTLMIVALSGICLYTVPEMTQTFSLLRILFLFSAGAIGGYGLVVMCLGCLIYLVSCESYGTPLTAPFSPLVKSDLKDSIYKGFFEEMSKRPISLKSKNKTRLKVKNDGNGCVKDNQNGEKQND